MNQVLAQTQNSSVKIGIVYSEVKREYFPTETQYITEKDAAIDAESISNYLTKLGISTVLLPGDESLIESLNYHKPDAVINVVDSVKGKEHLSPIIPGIMEMMNIPYTGADSSTLTIIFNKFFVKELMQQAGVPVPGFQLFVTPQDNLLTGIHFPLITKLNQIHGSVEIGQDAIVENEKQLRDRLKFLIGTYKQPVLAEEYIAGKEISAFVLEGVNKKVYFGEKVFTQEYTDKYKLCSFDMEWLGGNSTEKFYHYEKFEDPILRDLVVKAYSILNMKSYAKFDIIVDQSNRYQFIDFNANPYLCDKSDIAKIIGKLYGIEFIDILQRIVTSTKKNGNVNGNGNGGSKIETASERSEEVGSPLTAIN